MIEALQSASFFSSPALTLMIKVKETSARLRHVLTIS